MLRAEQEGIAPEELIKRVSAEHRRDFATFGISVDNYNTTHDSEKTASSPQSSIAGSPRAASSRARPSSRPTTRRRQMFLPDRYVRGTCPNCGTPDQYGDSCEICGATYSPLDLKDAVSTCPARSRCARVRAPVLEARQLRGELREWVPKHVDAPRSRPSSTNGSRRASGLGHLARSALLRLPDPGRARKFFYVWLDAPIGYMASFLNSVPAPGPRLRRVPGRRQPSTSSTTSSARTSSYFHALFWPAMLSGAGYRKPSALFVHGLLTVDGEKMSKSRGTFIPARTFPSISIRTICATTTPRKLGAASRTSTSTSPTSSRR